MADLVTELPDAFETATETYGDWHEDQNQTIQDLLPRGDADEIEELLGIEEGGLEEIISVEDRRRISGASAARRGQCDLRHRRQYRHRILCVLVFAARPQWTTHAARSCCCPRNITGVRWK